MRTTSLPGRNGTGLWSARRLPRFPAGHHAPPDRGSSFAGRSPRCTHPTRAIRRFGSGMQDVILVTGQVDLEAQASPAARLGRILIEHEIDRFLAQNKDGGGARLHQAHQDSVEAGWSNFLLCKARESPLGLPECSFPRRKEGRPQADRFAPCSPPERGSPLRAAAAAGLGSGSPHRGGSVSTRRGHPETPRRKRQERPRRQPIGVWLRLAQQIQRAGSARRCAIRPQFARTRRTGSIGSGLSRCATPRRATTTAAQTTRKHPNGAGARDGRHAPVTPWPEIG